MKGPEYHRLLRPLTKVAQGSHVPRLHYDHGVYRAWSADTRVELHTPEDGFATWLPALPSSDADHRPHPEGLLVGSTLIRPDPSPEEWVDPQEYALGGQAHLNLRPLLPVARNDRYPGILLEALPGLLRAVACDGRRAAWTEYPAILDGAGEFVVPLRAAEILPHGNLSLCWGSDGAVFLAGDLRVFCRPGGSFPPYRRVLPQEYRGRVTVKGLRQAVRDFKETVILDLPDGKVYMYEGNRKRLEWTAGPDFPDDPPVLRFDPRYLREALPKTDDVEICFNGPLDGVLFAGCHYLMPVRP